MKLVLGRRVVAATVAGIALMSTAACGSSEESASDAAGGVTTLKYMSVGVNLAEIADAIGVLDESIKIDRVGDASGGPEALQNLATGQIDFSMSYNGAIIKVASTGVPITSVITYSGGTAEVGSSLLVKEDSPIKEPKDLIGKKVALNTLGANSEAILDTWLRQGGLSDKEIADVTLVPMPGATAEGSLRQDQLDAGIFIRSERENALAKGGLRSVVSDHDLFGDYNIGTVSMADKFIEENPEATEEFVSSLAEANQWLREHTIEEAREVLGDYLTKQGREEEASALQYWTGNGVTTDYGLIEEKDFTLPLEWLVAEGTVDEKFDVSTIWTNKFNPHAKDAS